MNLQDITPANVQGITATHFGRAEPGEVARLASEPHAVLNEAGLNISEDYPVQVLMDFSKNYISGNGLFVYIIIGTDQIFIKGWLAS